MEEILGIAANYFWVMALEEPVHGQKAGEIGGSISELTFDDLTSMAKKITICYLSDKCAG